MSDPVTHTPEVCEGCWFLLAHGRVFPGCTDCATLKKYRPDLAEMLKKRQPADAGKE